MERSFARWATRRKRGARWSSRTRCARGSGCGSCSSPSSTDCRRAQRKVSRRDSGRREPSRSSSGSRARAETTRRRGSCSGIRWMRSRRWQPRRRPTRSSWIAARGPRQPDAPVAARARARGGDAGAGAGCAAVDPEAERPQAGCARGCREMMRMRRTFGLGRRGPARLHARGHAAAREHGVGSGERGPATRGRRPVRWI